MDLDKEINFDLLSNHYEPKETKTPKEPLPSSLYLRGIKLNNDSIKIIQNIYSNDYNFRTANKQILPINEMKKDNLDQK